MKLPAWREGDKRPEGETMTDREMSRQTLIKLALIDGFLRDFRDESHDQKRVIYERLAEIELRLAEIEMRAKTANTNSALERLKAVYYTLKVVEGRMECGIGSSEENFAHLQTALLKMAAVLRDVFPVSLDKPPAPEEEK
jgi:hypothetical protein